MRGSVRSLAVGAVIFGAAAVGAVLVAAPASAVGLTPVPGGGVEVDLNHEETVWVYQNDIGTRAAGLPHPSAESFGTTLQAATGAASQYPQGHVSFVVFGPLNNLNGSFAAFKD